MTPKEVEAFLRARTGQRLRITFADGIIQSVDISSVDEEGFLHSGPDGENQDGFWTRFEDVSCVSTQL